MKKIKVEKADKLILKAFLKLKYPSFAHQFNFDLDADWYYGVADCLLKGTIDHIDSNTVISIDSKLKSKLWDYVIKSNNTNDMIYLSMLKTLDIIFNKYFHNYKKEI